MAGPPWLIDSNVLLRWVQPNDPDYSVVASALETLAKRGAVLCYTSQNVAEFWSACTRPVDRNGFGLTPRAADRRAQAFESRLHLLPDSLSVHQEWRRLIVAYDVAGVQVHDARLVAAMRVHGVVPIHTFNERDFARYTEIQAIHPRAVVALHP